MKKPSIVVSLLLVLVPVAADAQVNIVEALRQADGHGRIIAADGRFLGVLSSDRLHETSICNPIGEHGSNIGNASLWNQIDKYGDRISDTSAYNTRASYPPQLVIANSAFYITKNPRIKGIDPDVIRFALCEDNR
ncbi:MAG TPA: hypothetical protein V6D19_00440 [Stenomitos sp.]